MNENEIEAKLSGKYHLASRKEDDKITATINGITFSAMYKVGNLNQSKLDTEWLSRDEFMTLMDHGYSEDEIRDMTITKIRNSQYA